jgi:tape measure domain-containing protein
MAADGSITIDTKIDGSTLKRQIAGLKDSIKSNMATIRDIMQGPVAAFNMLRDSIVSVGRATVGQAAKIEDLVAAFTPLTGGAESAAAMIAALNKEAASTPFQLEQIGSVAKQLLPILGNDVEAVTGAFRMLGDTAGGNAQKLDSITRGYSKAMLKGRVDMESLNMIAEAGVPIYTELAESMGISVEQMMELSSAGKITDTDLTNAFQRMTSEGGIFFNGMQIASETLSGRMSTLRDNIALAGATIGNMFLPLIKDIVDESIKIVSKFSEWASETGNLENALKLIVTVITAGTAGFIAYNIATNAAAIATAVLTAKQLLLNGALLANPAVAITAGVIALTGAMVAFGFSVRDARIQQEELNKALTGRAELSEREKALENVRKQIEETEKLIGDGSRASSYAHKVRLDELKQQESQLVRTIERMREGEVRTAAAAAERESQLAAENAALAEQQRLEAEKASAAAAEIARLKAREDQAKLFLQTLRNIDALAAAGAISEQEAIERKIALRQREIDLLIQAGEEGTLAAQEVKTGVDEQVSAIERYNERLKQLSEQKTLTDYYKRIEEIAVSASGDISEESRKMGERIPKSFAQELVESAHIGLKQIQRFTDSIADVLTSAVPSIGGGARIISDLIGSVSQTLIAAYSGDAVGAVVGGLGIIGGAIDLFKYSIESLANYNPQEIFLEFEAFIAKLENAIMTNLGSTLIWFNKGVDILTKFIGGLLANLPSIVATMKTVVIGMVEGIAKNLPMIIDAAIMIGTALIVGLIDMMPAIAAALVDVIPALVKGFAAMIPLLITALLGVAVINTFWPQLLMMMFDPKLMWDIGKAILEGLGAGLVASWNIIVSSVTSFVTNFINIWKKLFGINSPSTIFAGFGENIIQGLINGIVGFGSSMWDKVKGVFTSLVDNIKAMFTNIIDPEKMIGDAKSSLDSLIGSIVSSKAAGIVSDSINAARETASSVASSISAGLQTQIDGALAAAQSVKTFATDQIAGVTAFATTIKTKVNGIIENVNKVLPVAWKIPAFAAGTPYLNSDMLINAHQGERIVPKTFNQDLMAGNTMMLAPEALGALLSSITPGMSIGSGQQMLNLVVKMTGAVELDGREIGRAAFEYSDEFAGVAFGY